MKQKLHEKLTLFASNSQEMKKEFKWRNSLTRRLAALLYAFEDKPVDCNAIRECLDLIKSSAGIFSIFRGNMVLCVATMLSFKDNRKELFAQTKAVYEMMKDVKFCASDYLAVAAYEIAVNANPDNYEEIVSRARAFYKGMKAKGFFRTGEDDYIFTSMLGLSDIDVKEGTERIQHFYRKLKPDFLSGNSVQMLAQILVLAGESDLAVHRLYDLRKELKNRKLRLDKTFTLSSLGIFALLSVDTNTIVQDIEDAETFLKTQIGFGSFRITKQERLLLAASIVASVYAENEKDGVLKASVSTNIASIIITQQAAMIAAVSASGSAASSH